MSNVTDGTNVKAPEKISFGAKLIDIVVAIFVPLLPVFAGSGILRGMLLLAVNAGVLSDAGSTYAVLYAASSAVFTFLPFLLAVTTAKKFGASPFISMLIIGALMMPEYTALMKNGAGTMSSFMGIPMLTLEYTGQIISPIAAVIVQSYLEKFLNKHIPESLKMILVPAVSLVIMVPLTALIFGPVGYIISTNIGAFTLWLTDLNGWISGAVVALFWNVMIMFGLHWAINTMVIIPELGKTGNSMLMAVTSACNFAMAGACFGVWLRTKNKDLKSYSMSSIISVAISGIVEPALYGVALQYKRPLIAGSIASAVTGAFLGGFGVLGHAFIFGSVTCIPAFIGSTFPLYIAGLVIAFVTGAILTILLGWDDSIPFEVKEF